MEVVDTDGSRLVELVGAMGGLIDSILFLFPARVRQGVEVIGNGR